MYCYVQLDTRSHLAACSQASKVIKPPFHQICYHLNGLQIIQLQITQLRPHAMHATDTDEDVLLPAITAFTAIPPMLIDHSMHHNASASHSQHVQVMSHCTQLALD
jgi:hypothetical protein